MKDLLLDWGGEVFRKVALGTDDQSDENLALLQFFQLSPDSRLELLKDIADLEEKYARRTIAELNSKRSDLYKIRFLLALTPGSFFQTEHSILRTDSGSNNPVVKKS